MAYTFEHSYKCLLLEVVTPLAANVGNAIATIIARASRNMGMRFFIVDI